MATRIVGLLAGSLILAHTALGADLQRVTTGVPFPRGLVLFNGKLYVLARGISREFGGVTAAFEDHAGTIFAVDPNLREPISDPVSDRIRTNATVVAEPTSPPFRLLDRSLKPIWEDRLTDRPYCTLRYHPGSQSFYLCAFSGLDRYDNQRGRFFTKNATDALIRYDLRAGKWYDIERHDPNAEAAYPNPDWESSPPPRGRLKGPDNCLVVGDQLYAVAKDNSVLVRYDLSDIVADPEASPPAGELVMDHRVACTNAPDTEFFGQSALAAHEGYLYIGYRTSGTVIRISITQEGLPKEPIRAELLARFEPWDPATRKSANITDLDFDSEGRLYVLSAKPARVHRFHPDPDRIYDARPTADRPEKAWLDVAEASGNPTLKCENILLTPEGELFVSGGQTYNPRTREAGFVLVTRITD